MGEQLAHLEHGGLVLAEHLPQLVVGQDLAAIVRVLRGARYADFRPFGHRCVVPVYMFTAPFVRLSFWVTVWALALAALETWMLAADDESSAWWRRPLFAFASSIGQ